MDSMTMAQNTALYLVSRKEHWNIKMVNRLLERPAAKRNLHLRSDLLKIKSYNEMKIKNRKI